MKIDTAKLQKATNHRLAKVLAESYVVTTGYGDGVMLIADDTGLVTYNIISDNPDNVDRYLDSIIEQYEEVS